MPIHFDVLSTPSCGRCVATMSTLSRLGYDADKVDVTQDMEARERVIQSGSNELPRVEGTFSMEGGVTGTLAWSGMNHHALLALRKHHDNEAEAVSVLSQIDGVTVSA